MDINITIAILDIIHRPVFVKHDVSQIGFCLRLQVESTEVGPIDRAYICLRTPETTPIGFIKPKQHKPTMRVYIFHI
jgi:hypothetical protein